MSLPALTVIDPLAAVPAARLLLHERLEPGHAAVWLPAAAVAAVASCCSDATVNVAGARSAGVRPPRPHRQPPAEKLRQLPVTRGSSGGRNAATGVVTRGSPQLGGLG